MDAGELVRATSRAASVWQCAHRAAHAESADEPKHRIIVGTMVRDGYIYGLSFLAVAAAAEVGYGQLGVE